MELKLARCEALFSHGHTATATAKAAELITHMRGCLPSVVWRYDEVTEGMTNEYDRINATIEDSYYEWRFFHIKFRPHHSL